MILTALFPAPRYLSKYSDSVSMRLYSLTLTPPRNSGFDLRVARPFYPFLGALANVSLWTTLFARVEQRAQNLDKPRRMRERIEDRVVKRLKLLWSGGERRLVGVSFVRRISWLSSRTGEGIHRQFHTGSTGGRRKEGRFDPGVDRLAIEAKRYIVISGQVGPR